jgi:hypothetical protein
VKKINVATGALAIILILLSPATMFAQAVANAQIHGVITDSTDAVVPGAQVKATQTATGQVRTTVTTSDGSYVLSNLAVGPYTLEVTSQSFRSHVQSGIVLQVGNNAQVNVALQVGAVTQEVQVAANATMVETQDTSISEVIDQRRIIDLPLNGRQATDLILLTGGAAVPPNASRVAEGASGHDYISAAGVAVSGGQANSNNYLLDGGDNNDSHSNVNLPFPFPDALQEFSVQTNGVSARYGMHPGAVVNVVTKSGTNQLHGTLFEFVRNGNFNARNFFAPAQDTLRRNQFGGTIGGPIKKDKLFLFSGYQGTRTRTAPPQSIGFVPTQQVIAGDFSAIESATCQSNGRAVTLVNPANGQPFPNNQIPVSLFSAPSLALLKYIPVSKDPCGRLIYSIPSPSGENQYIGRVDWLQSSKHNIYGRYYIADYYNPGVFTDNILTTTRSELNDRSQSVTIAVQSSLTPTLVNAVHATYSRLMINRIPPKGMPSPVSLGVKMFNSTPDYIDLSVTSAFAMGGGSNAPSYFGRNQYQLSNDVDMIRGRHHLVFGGEAIELRMNSVNVTFGNGEFVFNGSLSNGPIADFMLGRPNMMLDSNTSVLALRQKYYGLYFQDDIRVNKKLNIHAGVRWEPSLPQREAAGRGQHFSLPAFVAGQKTSTYTNAPAGLLYHGDPGIPEAYANGSNLGFAPRFGLAWDPAGNGKQSIRASYGIFFETPHSYTNKDFAAAPPWASTITLTAPAGGFADPFLGYPGGNPFPNPFPPRKDVIYNSFGTYTSLPLNLSHMYTEQWDLSLQRQIGSNWIVSASYLGMRALHLRAAFEQNPAIYGPGATLGNTNQRRLLYRINPIPGVFYGTITTMDDGVNSNYHALRLSAQHRFSQNFTLLSVYTYSHCMQTGQVIADRVSLGANTYQNPANRNADYGNCDADLRHNLVNSFVYQTPKFANRRTNLLVGNWKLALMAAAHVGFPFYPTTGTDASLTGIGQDRPNVVGSPYVRNTDTLVWINAKAFAPNAAGTYGNAGWNSLIAPAYFNMDTNLTREFPISERQRFELRFEFFNMLNHTNFSAPVSRLSSATFGLIQSSLDPRILQFAAKYSF